MVDERNDEQRSKVENRDGVTTAVEAATQAIETKRPYQPPRLRHLGSVRELTWGGGTSFNDGVDLESR
jgi:hypothetical protein